MKIVYVMSFVYNMFVFYNHDERKQFWFYEDKKYHDLAQSSMHTLEPALCLVPRQLKFSI